MYTFDTNAIIYYLTDETRVVGELRKVLIASSPVYVSTITELELFSYPELTVEEAVKIEEILATVSIVPLGSKIARIGGYLRRVYGLKTADSAIGATAIFTGTTLVTRNISDFRRISELKVFGL